MKVILSITIIIASLIIIGSCKTDKVNEKLLVSGIWTSELASPDIFHSGDKYDDSLVFITGYLYTGYGISSVYEEKKERKSDTITPGICLLIDELENLRDENQTDSKLANLTGVKVFVIGYYDHFKESKYFGECYGELTKVLSLTLIE